MQRLTKLRNWISTDRVDAVIIPSTDPHQSEYPPAHHRVREWISGFKGSAGTVVVTTTAAGLWTDSRYFLEAETVLAGTGIELHRLHTPGVRDYPDWIIDHLSNDTPANRWNPAVIAVDSRVVSMAAYRALESKVRSIGASLIDLKDAIDTVWRDRPALPVEPIFRVPAAIAGEDANSKIDGVRRSLGDHRCTTHIISTLDDIAWTLNLRGRDDPYNPVFLAYLVVGSDAVTLYTDPRRIDSAISEYLASRKIELAPYERFLSDLPSLGGPILLDPRRTSRAVAQRCSAAVVEATQPATVAKAHKNAAELSNLRDAMRSDGVAMVQFLSWLDGRVADGAPLDELSAAAALRSRRAAIAGYISDSFNYISGFNANGALVHYAADERSNATFTPPGVYLIDSGGQYTNGTTDITRTVAIGPPPDEARRDFTLVLKGMIALSTLLIPEGTAGHEIDAIARAALWRDGKNYGHGTGHGVGFFLNVHEGPQRIAPTASDWPLEPGMIVSNEPGLYRPGKWGIRIENILAVTTDSETEFGRFLSFETLTLCPIDRRMIEPALLTAEERDWVNRYHARVGEQLSPALETKEHDWLAEATAPWETPTAAE